MSEKTIQVMIRIEFVMNSSLATIYEVKENNKTWFCVSYIQFYGIMTRFSSMGDLFADLEGEGEFIVHPVYI